MSESADNSTGKQSSRRRNAVPTLVDAGCLPAGTEVFLTNLRGEEERRVAPLTAADPGTANADRRLRGRRGTSALGLSGHQKLPESGSLSKSTSRVPSLTWNYPALP